MAGTISNTTKVKKIKWAELPADMAAQAAAFASFAVENGVRESPYPATFDRIGLPGSVEQYYLVYEKIVTEEGSDQLKQFGISINVQVAGPNTSISDCIYLRDFYGMDGPLPAFRIFR